jgi:mannitol-1-phosphate/altronate dehydrogenase
MSISEANATLRTVPSKNINTPRHSKMAGKKGVHFGGGNIGRGFVAEFLHNSGFEVVFVDVMDNLIETLQKTPRLATMARRSSPSTTTAL